MPNTMVKTSGNSTGPPKIRAPASASSAVEPVIRVRDRRSFSDRSMTSRSGMRRYLRRFSRSRSKVMTFSFIE